MANYMLLKCHTNTTLENTTYEFSHKQCLVWISRHIWVIMWIICIEANIRMASREHKIMKYQQIRNIGLITFLKLLSSLCSSLLKPQLVYSGSFLCLHSSKWMKTIITSVLSFSFCRARPLGRWEPTFKPCNN